MNFNRTILRLEGLKKRSWFVREASGKERRHVRHVNHEASKAIVKEALEQGTSIIAMEKLTHIRKRIKAGKRLRSRQHRWRWHELQTFIEYKAHADWNASQSLAALAEAIATVRPEVAPANVAAA